jgi:hypothetical protein
VTIKQVKEGDLVWAKDPQTGESGYYTVTWTTNHVTDEVVQITVSGSTGDSFAVNELSLSYDGDFVVEPAGIAGAKRLGSRSGSSSGASPAPADSYSETIEATAAHPIWVVGKGWVDAGALVVGDKLLAKDGTYLTVTKLGLVKKQVRVYNFEVAKLHTYFVGGQQQQWLVHNVGSNPCLKNTNVKLRNKSFAGTTYYFDQSNPLFAKAKGAKLQKMHNLAQTYRNGVPFDKDGFADFSGYAVEQVEITMRGNYTSDFTAARDAVRVKKGDPNWTPDYTLYTWHHHQDRKTMQLVEKYLHENVGHTGGLSIIEALGMLP